MRVNRFDSISQSYERAQGYLLQREAYHALILGLIDAVSKSPNRFTHPPYFATVEADETILAVALQTPPRKLLLSQVVCPEAVEVIAFDFYQTQQLPLAGVIGPTIAAYTFAQTWDTLTGQVYQKAMTQPFFPTRWNTVFPPSERTSATSNPCRATTIRKLVSGVDSRSFR